MKHALSVLIILFFVPLTSAKTYKAEGRGYTEESAIQNALNQALQMAADEMLTANNAKEKKAQIQKQIKEKAQTYVANKILISSEKEFGLVKVLVAAEIVQGKLRKDLAAQKLLYEAKNKPRIMIMLDEKSSGEDMAEKTASHKFEEVLLQKGFKLVEPEQFQKINEAEKARALNDKELASLGFRFGADLIIRGGVTAGKPTPKKIYGKDFFTVPVQLNAHVVKADNGEIIASKTKRVKKNSQEEFSAAQFGLEKGGEELAKELMDELLAYWQSELYVKSRVELQAFGFDVNSAAQFRENLQKIEFVEEVKLRFFEGKNAVYDVELKGSIQDLRELFSKDKIFNVSIHYITADKIGVKKGNNVSEIKFEYEGEGLSIEEFAIQEIFPSRVRYYENHPLAKVRFSNLSNVPLKNVKVSVYIPKIMDLPSNSVVKTMAPGENSEVGVNLILNSSKLLSLSQTQTMNGQVTLEYIEKGKKEKRQLTTPVKVLDKNAMDWMEPASLASFITYQEPTVHNFAREAVSKLKEFDFNVEISSAMAIFEALKEHGIKYVKDPSASPGNRELDRVQFPHETLESKTGDCDDTSVLFSALLTAVGIEAAVISYPDHVLVWFNTGVYAKNRLSLGADPRKTIVHKGTIWIPVETTLISKGFTEAWTVAAEEFQKAISLGEHVAVIELNEAWKQFGAAALDTKEKSWKIKTIEKSVFSSQKKLKEEIIQSWKTAIEKIEKKEKPDAGDLNKLGILYARAGNYTKAQKIFSDMLAYNKMPEFMNNLACAQLLEGDEKKALSTFEAALSNKKLPGVAVNRALTFYVGAHNAADLEKFVSALKQAEELMPKGTKFDEFIGFNLGESGEIRSAGEHEKQQKQKINKRELRELIKKRVLSKKIEKKIGAKEGTSTALLPYGGVRGADPEQIEKIVNLLYWYDI